MLDRRDFLRTSAAGLTMLHTLTGSAAEPRIRQTRTIASFPQSVAEVKDRYENSRDYSAELIGEDEPFEIKSFTPVLTKRDEIEVLKRLPDTCTRRHALSVGLEILREDQKLLPTLSRDQILQYLKSHFVSVQVRIYREPVSRSLYFGPRCLAATRTFQNGGLTQEFSPTVADAVGNMRSLGLLLPEGTSPTPSNLRTLVIVHKNELQPQIKGVSEAKVSYEYLFIRGRDAGPERLELQVFATLDDRTTLHYLNSAESPRLPSDCSLRGAVHFTNYSFQGLYPANAIVRRTSATARKSFHWEELNQYAKKSFGTSANERMTQILDAIIDEKIEGSRLLEKPNVIP